MSELREISGHIVATAFALGLIDAAHVRAVAIAEERRAVLAEFDRMTTDVRGQIGRGRVSAVEGDLLLRRLRAMRERIELELHHG